MQQPNINERYVLSKKAARVGDRQTLRRRDFVPLLSFQRKEREREKVSCC